MSAFKVITGVGRSGTSALTEYANRCGLDIGNVKWIDKYKAGNEDIEFSTINQHLYKKGLAGIVNRIKDFDVKVAKDPHFIRDTRILRYWFAVRQDFEIIFCHRDYNEIMLSQRKKPDMMCPAYRCFPDLMQKQEEEFLRVCAEIGVPFQIIEYPFTDYKKANKLLGINNDGHIWKNLIY